MPATASAAPQKVKFLPPSGYQRVVDKDGQEKFCRNDLITGSRLDRQVVCYTQAQLEAQQQGAQDFMEKNGELGLTAIGAYQR